jgi:hypothetical protein
LQELQNLGVFAEHLLKVLQAGRVNVSGYLEPLAHLQDAKIGLRLLIVRPVPARGCNGARRRRLRRIDDCHFGHRNPRRAAVLVLAPFNP